MRIYVVTDNGVTDLHPPALTGELIDDGAYALWWGTSPQRTAWVTRADPEDVRLLQNWPVDGSAPIYSGYLHTGNPHGQVTLDHEAIVLPLHRWCERRGLIRLEVVTVDQLEQVVRAALGSRSQDEVAFYGSFVEAARNALSLKIWT
jgi:hypothetical protein